MTDLVDLEVKHTWSLHLPSKPRSVNPYPRSSIVALNIAINKFDGAMTKGQTISIRLLPPATVRQAPGRPSGQAGAAPGASLLSRIQGTGPTSQPARGRGAAPRGGNRGRGAVRGGGQGGGRGGRRPPASGEDLDKQLDSFMAGDKSGDVEMA